MVQLEWEERHHEELFIRVFSRWLRGLSRGDDTAPTSGTTARVATVLVRCTLFSLGRLRDHYEAVSPCRFSFLLGECGLCVSGARDPAMMSRKFFIRRDQLALIVRWTLDKVHPIYINLLSNFLTCNAGILLLCSCRYLLILKFKLDLWLIFFRSSGRCVCQPDASWDRVDLVMSRFWFRILQLSNLCLIEKHAWSLLCREAWCLNWDLWRHKWDILLCLVLDLKLKAVEPLFCRSQ